MFAIFFSILVRVHVHVMYNSGIENAVQNCEMVTCPRSACILTTKILHIVLEYLSICTHARNATNFTADKLQFREEHDIENSLCKTRIHRERFEHFSHLKTVFFLFKTTTALFQVALIANPAFTGSFVLTRKKKPSANAAIQEFLTHSFGTLLSSHHSPILKNHSKIAHRVK